VARKDSDAIERIAEEASAKDRTGWFKRTRWDEHLQAYPDWRILAYAIRIPADDKPRLQRVVKIVEELVEEAVQGLSTLSIETSRWLRSHGNRRSTCARSAGYGTRQASFGQLGSGHGCSAFASA
jgi:hypothetical protein